MASKVYFSDMRTHLGVSVLDKLRKLMLASGIGDIDFKNKYTAIKTHFGEPGNLAFLRPNYSKVIADIVKENGGLPFLTDCNTLYVGRRKNGLDHISAAYENGFTPFSTGCHVIIGDGIRGLDEELVTVPGGELIKEARIGKAVMEADIFISLTHFKGHETAGFGGAIKNIGMGCGSRAGKMDMHSDGKVHIRSRVCIGCGVCQKICAHNAQKFEDNKCAVLTDKCVGCGRCISVCPVNAIVANYSAGTITLGKKMAEYTKAVLYGRPNFHVSVVVDVSPNCDCHCENDAPIVPNIGMFASFDPVALDVACADAVNNQQPIINSALGEARDKQSDHFKTIFPDTDWTAQVEHAEKIGIGSREYELITV